MQLPSHPRKKRNENTMAGTGLGWAFYSECWNLDTLFPGCLFSPSFILGNSFLEILHSPSIIHLAELLGTYLSSSYLPTYQVHQSIRLDSSTAKSSQAQLAHPPRLLPSYTHPLPNPTEAKQSQNLYISSQLSRLSPSSLDLPSQS